MIIWQNLPDKWLSGTILEEKLLSCQILTKGERVRSGSAAFQLFNII